VKKPALFSLTLLALLGGWEIFTLWRVHLDAPEAEDWQAAQAFVRKDFRKGDLIVFAPAWTDPVGRAYLGDLLTIEDVARNDSARYPRVWEVSIRDASAPETRNLTPIVEERFGAVTVRRFQRAAPTIVFSTNDRARLLEVNFEPHLCVLLPPSSDPQNPARLDLGTIPMGTQLVAWAGLSDFRARKENWATAAVRVLVDGQEASRGSIANDDGWTRLSPAVTEPGAHRLVVEAWVDPTRGDPRRARLDLCVAVEARR
jgi:hypothetical protein